jgi:tyrosine-protein kinase Etk/Wzc
MSNYSEQSTNAHLIKSFLSQMLSLKLFYIASFILCLGLAFMVSRYSKNVYEVNTVIGPIEDQRSLLLGSNDLFRGLAAYEQVRNLENDINNIKSFTLVSSTLRNMNQEVGYFTKKESLLGHKRQLYPSAPFLVSIDKSHIQPVNVEFDIDIIDDNSYRLTANEDEVSLYNYVDNEIVSEKNVLHVDTICSFNEIVSNEKFKFVISLNRFDPEAGKKR